MFAVSALAVIVAIGSGIDLARAYFVRQKVSAVATLTCQYANRPTVVYLAFGNGGVASYITNVNSYSALALGYQNASWTQTTPFTATLGGAGTFTFTTSVSTLMMKIIGITSLPVKVSLQCFSIPASTPQQPVADATATMLVDEGFENSAYSTTYYHPDGTYTSWETGTAIPLVSTAPTNAGFVGFYGNEWIIMGYCLETDLAGSHTPVSSEPDGSSYGAQLDCDNGNATAGNSSISTKVYLNAGSTYELRWWYTAEQWAYNSYYGTSYICGTTAADTSWATDTSYPSSLGAQTNQINAYLDKDTTGSPPTHTTIYGAQTLAGLNLIDECVYSHQWIERSVPITVTTSGYYWLSFAADGANDSYGGMIDDIRLCLGTCSGTVNDNFPTTWLSQNDGVLFEDFFDSPAYTYTLAYQPYSNQGVLGSSEGTSSAWDLTGKGWGNPTDNQALYFLNGCPEPNSSHTQCINLGWGQNQSMARPFLLVPGYYEISYYYASQLTFPSVLSSTAVYCGATPSDSGVYPTLTSAGNADGINRVTGTDQGSQAVWTGSVGVFMAHAQMASEPITSTSLGSATQYTSPSGATESSPSVSPDDISLTSYTAPTVSALLDICGYATTKQLRTVDVFIQKPAFYWLIFSTVGTRISGYGAQIDDVKITALGSPNMSGAPSSAFTIPMPDPQPGTTISTYTGFKFTSKPYTIN